MHRQNVKNAITQMMEIIVWLAVSTHKDFTNKWIKRQILAEENMGQYRLDYMSVDISN